MYHRPHTTRIARHAPPTGFTLIELLVAMTILVLLATLVITGFKQDDTDRLSSTSRTVQAYLEGARSRAIADRQPRGIRLIASQNDPRVVDRLVYIGASQYDTGTLDIAFDGAYWIIQNRTPGKWARLATPGPGIRQYGRDLIRPGARIEIPAGSNSWYTILDAGASSLPDFIVAPGAPDGELMSIAGHYTPSTWNGTTFAPGPNPTMGTLNPVLTTPQPIAANIPYRLELRPTILPNSEPVTLDRGIVIDLDASQIPTAWRPASASSNYSPTMEIMFDSRGNVSGSLAGAGLLHLYVTSVADVELSRQPSGHPANVLPMPNSALYPFTRPTPDTDPRIITLYTQTGQVNTSQANLIDANTDQRADVPDLYRYAQRGMEASQ